MKRTFLAVLCGAALFAGAAGLSLADDSDKEMADRYLRAARDGDATAQFYLGALHSAGVGRPQSDTEAFAWFTRAAEQGHEQSTLIVGGLSAIGRGAPKDNVNGYKWASIALSESRSEEIRNGARQLMRLLESRLSPEDLRRARSQADRWRQSAKPSSQRPADQPVAERPRREPLPTTTSEAPRQNTITEATRSSRVPEPEKDSKPKVDKDLDDLLNRLPPAMRKRMGL